MILFPDCFYLGLDFLIGSKKDPRESIELVLVIVCRWWSFPMFLFLGVKSSQSI